jgi:hypothetical protein
MAYAVIGGLFALVVGLTVWLVKRAERMGRLKENGRVAKLNAKLTKASENVAKLAGPARARLGEYWAKLSHPGK